MGNVITVYTASYEREKEEFGTSKVEIEDSRSYPSMFDSQQSANSAVFEHARAAGFDIGGYVCNVKVQARQAIRLANGERFLLCGDRSIPAIFLSGFFQLIVKYVSKHAFHIQISMKEYVVIWSGEDIPPGNHKTEVVIKVDGKYYLLDSWALIGLRVHYESLARREENGSA